MVKFSKQLIYSIKIITSVIIDFDSDCVRFFALIFSTLDIDVFDVPELRSIKKRYL